jgi:hypothetical protein
MIVWNQCIKRSYSCYSTIFDLHIYCFQNINRILSKYWS